MRRRNAWWALPLAALALDGDPGLEAQATWLVGEPVVTLGGIDAPDASFGRIGGVAVGSDGRIYVADSMVGQVSAYSPRGDLLFRFGQEGKGPGDFGLLMGLAVFPDGRLLTRDLGLERFQVFSPDGEYLDGFPRHTLPPNLPAAGEGAGAVRMSPVYDWPTLVVDGDGWIHDVVTHMGSGGARSRATMIYEPDGAFSHSLFDREWTRASVVVETSSGRLPWNLPFAPVPVATVDRRGRRISGDGTAGPLLVVGRDATTRGRIEVALGPPPEIPSRVRRRARDSLVAVIRDAVRRRGGDVPDVEVPRRAPSYTRLLADSGGDLWIGRSHGPDVPPGQYLVIGPGGERRARVSLPPMEITHIGPDRIVGFRTGAFDVPVVVVLPLERR